MTREEVIMELSSSNRTWSGTLVSDAPDPKAAALVARAACGIGLAAIYGLAVGARDGADSFLWHAIGVPLGAIAVALVAVPALFIILTLFAAPIEGSRLAAEACRALALFGLVLAGLAPAVALFSITSGADVTAAVVAAIGLGVAGALALRGLVRALSEELSAASTVTSAVGRLVSTGFVVFAVALAARIWAATLPMLGGAS